MLQQLLVKPYRNHLFLSHAQRYIQCIDISKCQPENKSEIFFLKCIDNSRNVYTFVQQ